MTVRRAAVLAAGLVAPLLLVGCGAGPRGTARYGSRAAVPVRPYVLVSGRDDHGLRELAAVPLLAGPEHGAQVGTVVDGTLARVLQVSGTWIRVAPVIGGSPPGWVDDYRLRGVVHLVGPKPACRVRLSGRLLPAAEQAEVLAVSGGRVTVRLVREPAVTGTVPLRFVRELPPSPDDPCPAR